MATVSKPFVNASISPLKRALSWCPISPTKIALVYVATTGGSPRYFVQIVNFVNGVPVYGPPCMILLQGFALTSPCLRMVSVGNNRLLFSVPKAVSAAQAYQHSFVLVKVNVDDTVEFLSESATLTTFYASPGSTGILGLIGGDGNACVYGTGVSSTVQQFYWPITITNDTVVIGSGQGNSSSSATTGGGGYSGYSEAIVRKALDDRQWVLNTWTSGVLYTSVKDAIQQTTLNSYNVVDAVSGYTSGVLPVRGDVFLSIQTTNILIRQLVRASPPTGQLATTVSTLLATLNWRNGSEYAAGKVEDSIWLDTDGSFVSAYTTGAPVPPSDPGTTIESAGTVAPLKLHIARYIEATQSIQQAADFPLDLNVNMPRRNWDRMLHKVDSKTIAVIGAFCPIGQFNVQHGIIMVTAP